MKPIIILILILNKYLDILHYLDNHTPLPCMYNMVAKCNLSTIKYCVYIASWNISRAEIFEI